MGENITKAPTIDTRTFLTAMKRPLVFTVDVSRTPGISWPPILTYVECTSEALSIGRCRMMRCQQNPWAPRVRSVKQDPELFVYKLNVLPLERWPVGYQMSLP